MEVSKKAQDYADICFSGKQRCSMLTYAGLGVERRCNKVAVAYLDGTQPVCAECAKKCHPLRLSQRQRQ